MPPSSARGVVLELPEFLRAAAGDGTVTEGTYPGHTVPNGGYTILELPSRQAALEWAAKIAVACRCAQELREFQYDPAS